MYYYRSEKKIKIVKWFKKRFFFVVLIPPKNVGKNKFYKGGCKILLITESTIVYIPIKFIYFIHTTN